MTVVTCQGRSLNLNALRAGIKKIGNSLIHHYLHVTNDEDIAFWRVHRASEDMTNDAVGYSWLSMKSWTQLPYPLLDCLFNHPDYNIAEIDRQGQIQWNRADLMVLRRKFAEINRLLAVLCFLLPSPPPRGTEFADTRITNTHIARNVYVNFGLWFIHHRVKTSALTDSLSWVPTLCPKLLADQVHFYCVVIRPVEILIAGILDDEESVAQHREFLWMQDGKKMTSEIFSHILERTLEQHMGVGLNLSSWRHIAIAIMREFIPPHLTGDHVGDTLSNHSTNQARQTYSRENGQLPFLTTDALLDSRRFCELWHDVLNVGGHPIPIPLRLQGYQTTHQQASVVPSAGPAPALDLSQINNIVSAAVANGIDALKLELAESIRKAVAQGMIAYQQMAHTPTPAQRSHHPTQSSRVDDIPVDAPVEDDIVMDNAGNVHNVPTVSRPPSPAGSQSSGYVRKSYSQRSYCNDYCLQPELCGYAT